MLASYPAPVDGGDMPPGVKAVGKHMRYLRVAGVVVILMSALFGATACQGGATTANGWKPYPHLVPQPMNDKPLLIIMCKVSDNSAEPTGLMDTVKRFFTDAGEGPATYPITTLMSPMARSR